MGLVLRFAGNVAALWLVARLIDGVSYGSDLGTLLLAALVLTVANAVVKPVVTVLAVPLIVVTLGFGLFFVSLAMLELTAWLVDGFRIDGFWAAVEATLVVWFVNVIFTAATRDRGPERERRREHRERVRAERLRTRDGV
jgi:putative membrane protein